MYTTNAMGPQNKRQSAKTFAGSLLQRLALGTALVFPALATPLLVGLSPAHAVCVQTGNDVLCAADDTNGFSSVGDITDLSVDDGITVDDSAADISNTSLGIVDINNNVTGTLLNNGTIRDLGGAADAIHVQTTLNRLINNGIISGGDDGIQADTITALTNSGTINGGNRGIRADEITTLNNSGTISGGDTGVLTINDIISLTNSTSGTISGGTIGMRAAADLRSLTNNGVISGGNLGIQADTSIGTLTNSGSINGGDNGIFTNTIMSLTNSVGGSISGRTDRGIAASTINSLTNFGAISGGNDGIQANTVTSLTNSGIISGGDYGIRTTNLASLTNSGTIGGGISAIQEVGGATDTALTLNAGSILIGRVDLGGGMNMLNIGEGLSLNSALEELDAIGQTSGLLVVTQDLGTSNAQVVTVDPSAFASFDDALAALTAGIGQTVQGRQSALRSDQALGFASSFASRYAAAEESLAAFPDLNLEDTPRLNPNRFWIEGFGAYREDDSERVGSTFESLAGGLVAGADVPLDAITSVGVMAGFAASTSENEISTQETDTTSYYAGVYASTQALGLAWDASLTVGYTDYDQQRISANNLVATGLETASADFGGWFVNPQVTATNRTPTGFAPAAMGFGLASIEQSLTLAYAGLFLDGYTETGTTNPLTLDDRSVHIASARAALALPFERIAADGALTTLRLIGGIEARTQFGDDDISGTLLGQSVSTTLGDDDATFGAFLGLAGEYQTRSGLTAYANAEALLETNASYQLSAAAGLRIAF